jgi:hypothetical protein
VRAALRDVIGRCIYAVDVNPMAVELCKVSLWLEALEPGKPLSFLDHHVQCGNSLLGATPRLLDEGIPDAAFAEIEGDDRAYCRAFRKQNSLERKGYQLLADPAQPWDRLGDLATALAGLDALDDERIEDIHRKEARYAELVRSSGYRFGRLRADAWCAAFVWKKTRALDYPITDGIFRRLERNPFDVAPWMAGEITRLAGPGAYNFLHWHLAFPDVFRVPGPDEEPENAQTGWSGGFDVMLGNPPWDRIKLQEKEWFNAYGRADIADAANAAQRQRMIAALLESGNAAAYDPALHQAFLDDRRRAEGASHLVRDSGRYPLTGVGDVNTYALFAETFRTLLNPRGRAGMICPTGIATDDTTKAFFGSLIDNQALAALVGFENEAKIFPAVDHRVKFLILTMTGGSM